MEQGAAGEVVLRDARLQAKGPLLAREQPLDEDRRAHQVPHHVPLALAVPGKVGAYERGRDLRKLLPHQLLAA